ncbi:MAG: glycosyl transferase, partial [Rhizobiaceae bacterium]|nr:glycosyl transferase [Rhizobiaceae bacterium]
SLGCRLVAVEHLPLSDEFNERHARGNLHSNAPFTKGRKPSFHTPLDNFCKLRLWQLIEYDTCVFIDADALVLRNVDKLFDYPEFSAAPNVYESLADFHRMNSGVFVARPSIATFKDMLKLLDQPDVFWRRTDQTFLETFFPDWHGLPVFMNMLQYIWFTMPALWDWNSISILHYQYEKPWERDHPKAEKLKPLIDLWHQFHSGHDLPDVAAFANPREAA